MKNHLIQSTMLKLLALVLVNGIACVAYGTVIYQDNFDNVAAGADPVAQIGTYIPGDTVGSDAKVGTGFAIAPSTPNYLDSDRTISLSDYRGDLAGAPLPPGTPVHAEVAIYAISGYTNWGLIETGNIVAPHDPVAGEGIIVVTASPTGVVLAIAPDGALVATGHEHEFNEWQVWEIDYVVGESSYTLTVGGVSIGLGSAHMKNSAATQLETVFSHTFSGDTRGLLDNMLIDAEVANLVPGDFDGDGDVDGADFVVWQTNFPTSEGGTLDTGDADGDGDVDGADFVVWQTNFPFTPGPGAAPVPEPASASLLAIAAAVLFLRRRVHRSASVQSEHSHGGE